VLREERVLNLSVLFGTRWYVGRLVRYITHHTEGQTTNHMSGTPPLATNTAQKSPSSDQAGSGRPEIPPHPQPPFPRRAWSPPGKERRTMRPCVEVLCSDARSAGKPRQQIDTRPPLNVDGSEAGPRSLRAGKRVRYLHSSRIT
jgi:hypothetical protein